VARHSILLHFNPIFEGLCKLFADGRGGREKRREEGKEEGKEGGRNGGRKGRKEGGKE